VKRRRKKRATSEHLPGFVIDIAQLPKETADAFRKWEDWLKATEPAAKAAREAYERQSRRLAYYAAVRDGLLPPPWIKQQSSVPAAKPGSAVAWILDLHPNDWHLQTAGKIYRKAAGRGCTLTRRSFERALAKLRYDKSDMS